jgi:hypothetical protein
MNGPGRIIVWAHSYCYSNETLYLCPLSPFGAGRLAGRLAGAGADRGAELPLPDPLGRLCGGL